MFWDFKGKIIIRSEMMKANEKKKHNQNLLLRDMRRGGAVRVCGKLRGKRKGLQNKA